MTKEELIKLSRENLRKSKQGSLCECYDEAFIKGYQLSEKRIAELEAQIEKMKKYIKACWVEENLNDYSSYITNTSDEFRDLVKELRSEKWEIKEK